ncbi:prepilin-type N-terminal cleavage/methylation domain-containing protein, partial [Patescibacteria group bacterium]|nr:prepilin-type N-terminal cleavage/methylation domain-containing protein [Patescibacteria group bacterium]
MIRASNMKKNGFTLIEVVVAIGIFGLVIGGMASVLSYSLKSNRVIWAQLTTQNEGRKVTQDFV